MSQGPIPILGRLPDSEVSCIPICDADAPFLLSVYASTRQDELARVQWPEAAKEQFLLMQFQVQHAHYSRNYENTEFCKIVHEQNDVGRVYIGQSVSEIRIIEISLLPAFRGKGIGAMVIRAILSEAGQRNLPVSLHVEKSSRANQFYRRLGFRAVFDTATHTLMKWTQSDSECVLS